MSGVQRGTLGVWAAACTVAFGVVVAGAWLLLGADPATVTGRDSSTSSALLPLAAATLGVALFLGSFARSVRPGRYRRGLAVGIAVGVGVALFQVVLAGALTGAGQGLDQVLGFLPATWDALVTPMTAVSAVAGFGAERLYAVVARRPVTGGARSGSDGGARA
ncbi:hypothetical protein GCM10025865_05530 [Paraoerskovia sediminicola]|uniref:Uncharacterized protein n=1 Tax=Paraoerskovia sediminicola TaxID=1138587 RepID=A0ABM8FZL0_9CELL|nr:hypothetical protein [Paraoerskovia sediminicola]BDZ41254.1 hypothetical protein GCM10025865_05530 [Paraoerskovia sediminicola]